MPPAALTGGRSLRHPRAQPPTWRVRLAGQLGVSLEDRRSRATIAPQLLIRCGSAGRLPITAGCVRGRLALTGPCSARDREPADLRRHPSTADRRTPAHCRLPAERRLLVPPPPLGEHAAIALLLGVSAVANTVDRPIAAIAAIATPGPPWSVLSGIYGYGSRRTATGREIHSALGLRRVFALPSAHRTHRIPRRRCCSLISIGSAGGGVIVARERKPFENTARTAARRTSRVLPLIEHVTRWGHRSARCSTSPTA